MGFHAGGLSGENINIGLVQSLRCPCVLLIALLSFKGEISHLIDAKSASFETKEIKTASIGTHNAPQCRQWQRNRR